MLNLVLLFLSVNTAVFVYTALHVVEYLKWKRKWREESK